MIETTDDYAYPAGNPNCDESRWIAKLTMSNSNNVMAGVLDEAKGIVCGARQDDYGTPPVNHERTAKLWSVFFGIPITPRQVCYANILQKCGREVNASKRDTDVDIAGYAANAAACHAVQVEFDGIARDMSGRKFTDGT
jgi:hypothetical protein